MLIFDLILGAGVVALYFFAIAMGLVVTCVIIGLVGIIEFINWVNEEKCY